MSMHFQLLAGSYYDHATQTNYKAGDGQRIVSDRDLDALFANKFRRIYPQETVAPANLPLVNAEQTAPTVPGPSSVQVVGPQAGVDHAATLELMTEDELKALAKAEEINIKGAKTKEQLIKTIVSALQE